MREIGIIGFPMDLGGNQRGVDMGPSAIRLTNFEEKLADLGVSVTDLGNVLVHTRALVDEGDASARYLDEIMRACAAAAEMTEQALDQGLLPVTLGGDHSVAIGSLRGMANRFGPGGAIWIDAHADCNTPQSTLSGNVHGMALAIALGRSADSRLALEGKGAPLLAEKTVLIGTRDLDPPEREYLAGPGAPTVFTIADIDRRGITAVVDEARQIASGAGFLHISFDLDVVDPRDAPGVGTPVRGGLSYREAHTMMEILSETDFGSLDMVEVNPVLDARNMTATLAGELICSLFGKTIL